MGSKDFNPFMYDTKAPDYILTEYRELRAKGKPSGGDDLKIYDKHLRELEFALVDKNLVRYPESTHDYATSVWHEELTTQPAKTYSDECHKKLRLQMSH